MNLEYVKKLSLIEKKNILERMVKLQEEVGELAQEILIAEKASGSTHKSPGNDGIEGECVDVMLVALSIFFKAGHDEVELEKIIHEKSQQWDKFQQKG